MVMFHQEHYGLQWKKNDFDVLGLIERNSLLPERAMYRLQSIVVNLMFTSYCEVRENPRSPYDTINSILSYNYIYSYDQV